MSYHWAHRELGVLLEHGDRALLPHVVEPGDVVRFPAGIWTPFEPGRYVLQWDLRVEETAWFSERGIAPLEVDVEVSTDERLLATPRTVATLPARASRRPPSRPPLTGRRARRRGLELAAANVVPIRPVRVLDTRDGTGYPGAVLGPVPAGQLVELSVAGQPGVPSHAVGVVATLSIHRATYNGFLTAFAADGTTGEAFVSAYFDDQGRPTANQVVVGLGQGAHQGRLALRPSDNYPGHVHLVVDVVGYVD